MMSAPLKTHLTRTLAKVEEVNKELHKAKLGYISLVKDRFTTYYVIYCSIIGKDLCLSTSHSIVTGFVSSGILAIYSTEELATKQVEELPSYFLPSHVEKRNEWSKILPIEWLNIDTPIRGPDERILKL